MQPLSKPSHARRPTPVVVLSGLTRSVLEPVELSVTFGLPTPALVRYEIDATAGTVTRRVTDATGTVEHEVIPLDHTCITCALRHEIVPSLTRLAEIGRWSALALSLPPATQPQPLVEAIAGMLRVSAPVRKALRLGAVVAAVETTSLERDLFGDDLLRERDGVLHAGDVRAVGEVLVDALEYADVLAFSDGHVPPSPRVTAVLDELRRPQSKVVRESVDLSADELLEPHDQSAAFWARPDNRVPRWPPPGHVVGEGDGVYDATSASAAAASVWTVLADTWRPFHPDRLMERIESLGGHSYRGRGCFWLPTHPNSLAIWAGAGGQLSIGTAAGRPARGPRTRLTITGIDDRGDQVRQDLATALMTEAELAAGLSRWLGRDDGFGPWLGDRQASA
jgi:G3E family GTPase